MPSQDDGLPTAGLRKELEREAQQRGLIFGGNDEQPAYGLKRRPIAQSLQYQLSLG